MTIEHALIGAAIISNGGTLAESPVKPNEFHEYALQNLWETILKQAQENKSCDALTLVSLLPKQAELIYDCVDACYSVDLAPVHAAEVKNKALARRVKDLGHQLIERKDTAQELIDYAQTQITAIADSQPVDDDELIGDTFDHYFVTLGEKQHNATTGLHKLDELLNGFKPGGLYIVGARPGVGKSVLALQMAWGFARNANALPVGEDSGLVLFHSLEMSKRELMNRLMANVFEIHLTKFEKGSLSADERNQINAGRGSLKRLMAINDNGGQSLSSIKAYARSFQRKGLPLKAVVIDYMGLIADANEGRNRYEAMTLVSGALKRLAKELNVPIVALAQLNRGVENRSDAAIPTLSDLRDSGSIEQDADVVILLSRKESTPEIITLAVQKNRHGQTGMTDHVFIGHFSKIVEG
jgi:replicative DNA helicase